MTTLPIRTLFALFAVAIALAIGALSPTPSRAGGDICVHCLDDAVNDTASSPGIAAMSRFEALPALRASVTFIGTDHRLRFAEAAGNAWQITVIDPLSHAGGCAMEIDEFGRPTVCYHDSMGALIFGRRDAAGWHLEPVLATGGVTGAVSMTRVPGGIGVAFVNGAQGALQYAEKIGDGPWSLELVAPVGPASAGPVYPSLIARDAYRAISFRDNATGTLQLATHVMGPQPWTPMLVDPAPGTGGYSSLIGDPAAGQFGVAYYDFGPADLRYAHTVAGGWAIDLVDGSNGRVGRSCGATLLGPTPSDLVGIAYYDQLHGDLDYAMKTGPAWQHAPIDTTGDTGAVLASGVSPAGTADTVGIVYARRPSGDLEYLWRAAAAAGVDPAHGDGALHASWARQSGIPGGCVRFTMPGSGPARLTILDALGRRVAEPLDRVLPAGPAELRWDGRDGHGRAVDPGIYFARLVTSAGTAGLRGVVLR